MRAVESEWKAEITGDRTVTVRHPKGHEFVMRFNGGPANEHEVLRTHWQDAIDDGSLRQAASAAARKVGKAKGWTY